MERDERPIHSLTKVLVSISNLMSRMASILIVDDEPDDCLLLRLGLQKAGVLNPVHEVGDGAAAIDYLLGVNQYANRELFPLPNLIISDFRMPRISGLELLEWIKHHEKLKRIPVILLSGSNSEEEIEVAYATGARLALLKESNCSSLCTQIKLVAVKELGILSPGPIPHLANQPLEKALGNRRQGRGEDGESPR